MLSTLEANLARKSSALDRAQAKPTENNANFNALINSQELLRLLVYFNQKTEGPRHVCGALFSLQSNNALVRSDDEIPYKLKVKLTDVSEHHLIFLRSISV